MVRYRIEVTYDSSFTRFPIIIYTVQVRNYIGDIDIWADVKDFGTFEGALELYRLLIK